MQYLHLQLSNISRYSVDLEVDLTNWNVINKETRRGSSLISFNGNFLLSREGFHILGQKYAGTFLPSQAMTFVVSLLVL